MRFRILALALFVTASASTAHAFVHISQKKPRLPVSPSQPTITFLWNGDAPSLRGKDEILDGALTNASDQQVMEALLLLAVSKWNNVDTSYLDFQVGRDAGVTMDNSDGIYAIVVESQDSKSVAAAALPNFDKDDSADGIRDGKTIFDCDITISRSKVEAKNLLRTIVHELGHCIGLGHPHSNYHSIMSYSSMKDSAELGLDDKAGITFLYPEEDISQDVHYLTACGSVGGLAGQGSWVLLTPVLALGLLGLARRRA